MKKDVELLLVGWICGSQICQQKKMDGVEHYTLPREVTLGENDKVLMNPVEELNLLREIEHNILTNTVISGIAI